MSGTKLDCYNVCIATQSLNGLAIADSSFAIFQNLDESREPRTDVLFGDFWDQSKPATPGNTSSKCCRVPVATLQDVSDHHISRLLK